MLTFVNSLTSVLLGVQHIILGTKEYKHGKMSINYYYTRTPRYPLGHCHFTQSPPSLAMAFLQNYSPGKEVLSSRWPPKSKTQNIAEFLLYFLCLCSFKQLSLNRIVTIHNNNPITENFHEGAISLKLLQAFKK